MLSDVCADEGDDNLFPLSEGASRSLATVETEADVDERTTKIQEYLIVMRPRLGDDEKRAGQDHQVYRTVEDLPETATAFYEKTGQISGLSVERLVKTVYRLERMIEKWIALERKARHSVETAE